MFDAVIFLYSVAVAIPPAAPAATLPAPVMPLVARAIARHASDAPDVDVWMPGAAEYRRGDVARVEFRTREDAYVTLLRVDTDGRLRVLFPLSPHDDAWVERGRTVRVPGRRGGTFTVDDDRGLGYVFAIASYDRFDFRRYAYDGRWDEHALGGRIHGDPFVAMHRVAERLLWDDRSPYSTAYAEYYVDGRVDYPRYVCYDCHSGARRGHRWDPYDHHCSQFRVVIYTDPYYYPYRYYPGTRVVYTRRPRYEFKEATRDDPITRTTAIERRRRDEGLDFRRPGAPTADPNLPGGPRREPGGDVGPGGGGTNPGDDVPDGGAKRGRRRGHEADGPGNSNDAPGHTGDRGPRRDSAGPPTDHPGNGNGPSDDRRRTPRRDGNDSAAGAPDESRGRGDERRRTSEQVPRRDDDGSHRANDDARRDDGERRTIERGPRRDEGSSDADDRGSAPRDERRDDARNERRQEPRGEPRSESRNEPRGERRSDTREERRAEPKSERRAESKSERRTESSSSSEKSRGSGDRSGGSRESTRRRSP